MINFQLNSWLVLKAIKLTSTPPTSGTKSHRPLILGPVVRYREREIRMSNRKVSEHSGRQKMTWFAAPIAPSEVMVLHTRGSPISAAQDHVNFHSVMLCDKWSNCLSFAPQISWCGVKIYISRSQVKKLKTDNDYVPKSAQIKLELDVEKVTKEGKALQSLSEKHSQFTSECQFQLKSLVI